MSPQCSRCFFPIHNDCPDRHGRFGLLHFLNCCGTDDFIFKMSSTFCSQTLLALQVAVATIPQPSPQACPEHCCQDGGRQSPMSRMLHLPPPSSTSRGGCCIHPNQHTVQTSGCRHMPAAEFHSFAVNLQAQVRRGPAAHLWGQGMGREECLCKVTSLADSVWDDDVSES